MNAEELLILDEAPTLVKTVGFHEPNVSFTKLNTLVRVEKVVLHGYFIG
jgi:hypothetical protein